jgi:ABC-type multidrug transport system fused ATPase/permease subunit
MDIREYLGDIILIIILFASTYLLLAGLTASPALMAYGLLVVLSIAGLFLIIHHKIRTIELNITNRERMIRVSLEEISVKMAQRYESSIERIEGIVTEVAKRVYR